MTDITSRGVSEENLIALQIDEEVEEVANWRRNWRSFKRNRPAVIGLVVLFLILAAAIFGPMISPYDTLTQDLGNRLKPPSLAHPMGTDELGRDSMTRILAGGRVSLGVAALATTVAITVGTTIGSIAGFYGRWIDNVLMRFTDLALSLPDLFLLILAASLLGPSFTTMVIIIGLVRWMNVARLVRGSFLTLREREFVLSARASGTRSRGIIFKHLLPNSLSPLIVAGTLGVASAIIAESTLSFLGLGLQPPASSWGTMLRNAQQVIFSAPWAAVFPGVMIFLTVVSVNFIGDGLRDVFDPSGTTLSKSRFHRRLERLQEKYQKPQVVGQGNQVKAVVPERPSD
ncbi:glutathione transport system permease protein GsiD [bacterium BMS3Bbin02]|nr:glutathione transport system permease protein GsiD [bacterium BMS3Bbin02]